jgi:hypothetical protein
MVVGVATHVPPTALQKHAASPALHWIAECEVGKENKFKSSRDAITADNGMIKSDLRPQQPSVSLLIA